MHCLIKEWRTAIVFLTVCLCAGCSSFTYSPAYPASYPPLANRAGLAIQRGKDLRPPDRITPGWCKPAEPIVARALAEEARHANLFERVKVHPRAANPNKYPILVECDVIKFDCVNTATVFENIGRTVLQAQGLHGALIAASIPSEYTSEIEIRFQVLDPATGLPKFARNYRAQRTTTANGYQGKKPLMQQTSAALEEVIAQFLRDLAKMP